MCMTGALSLTHTLIRHTMSWPSTLQRKRNTHQFCSAEVQRCVSAAPRCGLTGAGAVGAGQMDRVLEGKLADLQLALALRPADAKKMRDEVVSATYK